MGLLKRLKKVVKKVGRATITRPAKFVYRQARKDVQFSVKIASKTAPYVTAVAAGAASYFGGPVAGAAVGAFGSEISYRLRKEYGREVGESYKTRTDRARSVRRRSAKAAGVGLGVGAIGSGITTAALGGTFGESVGAGAFGQGGSQLLGVGGPTVFSQAPASVTSIGPAVNFAEVATLKSTVPTAAEAAAPSAAAATSGPGIWTTLLGSAVTGASSGVSRGLSTQRGTGAQTGPSNDFLAGLEAAALQAAGLGGGGAGGQIGDGFPNVQNTGGGGTDWMNLLLIAAAVYAGAKILKVA